MEVLEKLQVSKEHLKNLVSEMSLDNTLDRLQNYHTNQTSFSNSECVEHEDCYLSMNVSVDTNFINDQIIIDHVSIGGVELWVNEDEQVEITNEMIMTLEKETTNKIKNLV